MEILVAVAILALAYMAVMQNFSVSMRNIERLDRERFRLFADTLDLEQQLIPKLPEDDTEAEGEEYLTGNKYKLMLVTNEKGDLATLVLEKL